MRINGLWYLCDDGIVRPVLVGDVRTATGTWYRTKFLVDTAADRTVLTAAVLQNLGFPGEPNRGQLEGVGGQAASVEVQTPLRLFRENGGEVQFNGRFAAFLDLTAIDMNVLGRDILNLFAVIVDRPRDVVCLLAQDHYYDIFKR